MPAFVTTLLMIVLLLTAIFMIVLVLVQRGKGGGLAGAFGGMGGQSAFGTKAGDLFTKITIGVAAFWIILCIVTAKLMGVGAQGPLDDLGGADQPPGVSATETGETQPADQTPAKSESQPAEKTEEKSGG